MMCPNCDYLKTYIIESVENDDYSTRRRRECPVCKYRFTTYERLAQMGIIRRKRDGQEQSAAV